MKKLNLQNLKLDSTDLLQREQLKSIIGGYGGGDPCKDECTTNDDCTDPNYPVCRTMSHPQTCPDHPEVKVCFM